MFYVFVQASKRYLITTATNVAVIELIKATIVDKVIGSPNMFGE